MDYRLAFDLAPIGMVLSRHRLMVDCNRQMLAMFGAQREQLIGLSFEVLYPTPDEFERTGARIVASLDQRGFYADDTGAKRQDIRIVVLARQAGFGHVRHADHRRL